MGQQRRSCQQNQLHPFSWGQPTGAEGCHKIRKFRHQHLQPDANGEGGQHQLIFQMVHTEKAGFHVPHPHRVEKLGDAKHREGCLLYTSRCV